MVLFKDVTGYAIRLRTFAGNLRSNPQKIPKKCRNKFNITGFWELENSLSILVIGLISILIAVLILFLLRFCPFNTL